VVTALDRAVEVRFVQRLGDFELDVDLSLPGHGVAALCGRSGSGKTSLLNCMAGLSRARDGRLIVNGECWHDEARGVFVPPHRRALGYVFQRPQLFPHLDVRGNLLFAFKRVAADRRRIAWDQATELLGITYLLDRTPRGLSGGECQRVCIARALLASPDLLLLDEPLAALDVERRQEILPFLERLPRRLAIPVVYVSHAPEEVTRLADHIVVLERGKVVVDGPLIDTLTRLDLPMRLGDDAGVVFDGVVAERDAAWHLAKVDYGGGGLWVRDGGAALGERVRVRVLARDVSIALQRADSSIANVLDATVIEMADDEHPSQVMVRLQTGSVRLLARVTGRSAAQLGLAPGLRVLAQIKAVAVL
jgi:molybdate transport system ATP-binding protein